MIRFTWLQFRTQAAVAIGGLAVVAVVLAITGPHLAHLYDTTVANCRAHNDCQTAMAAFLRNDRSLQAGLDALVVVVPGIIWIFWLAAFAHPHRAGRRVPLDGFMRYRRHVQAPLTFTIILGVDSPFLAGVTGHYAFRSD